MERDGGVLIAHQLIGYVRDRERHRDRWVGALEAADVPLRFVWGLLDPVSGAHMIERVRERLPDAPVVELADLGHWPMLEAPDRVAAALRAAATQPAGDLA
jgi:pimeloyl-ACP methyl ester carboxylesterase